MKKCHFIILIAVLLLMFCGCQKQDEPDVPVAKGETGVYVLVATYTNNARLITPKNTATVSDKNQVALAPLDCTVAEAGNQVNLFYYTMDTDTSVYDSLVGQPVKAVVEEGKLTAIESLPSVQGYAYEFTRTSNTYFYKGSVLKLDSAKLNDEKNIHCWCQAVSGIWAVPSSDDYYTNVKTDDIFTFTDINGDGKYDYFCEYRIQNGLQLDLSKCQEGSRVVFTNGGFGTVEYSGWFTQNSGMAYRLCGELEGKKLSEIGDRYLNVRVVRDSEHGAFMAGTVAALCEIYPAETVDGTLENYAPKFYDEFSAADNTITVDGKEYKWSSIISTNAMCDGPAGINAGRQLQTMNLSHSVTLVFDMAGFVVKAVPEDLGDLVVTYTTFESDNGTQAAAVFDVQAWWHGTITTFNQLQYRVKLLYDMGIRRLYVVTCNPGFPQFSNNGCGRSALKSFDSTVEAFKQLGYQSPDHAFADICHDLHMECYAVYKVYEGGGMENIPKGYAYDESFDTFEGFGGWTVQLDTFLTENLKKGIDYRICRRNDGANDNLEGIVDKITVDFLVDSYINRGNMDRREQTTTVAATPSSAVKNMANGKTYTNIKHHPYYHVNVWVSENNAGYKLYEGSYSYTYVKGNKVLYDANGDAMFDGASKAVVTLEITGLAINEDFMAVTFECTDGMRTDPLSWMHVYSGEREIYTSTTDFVRRADFNHDKNPQDYVWGRNSTPVAYGSCKSLVVKNGIPCGTPAVANNSTYSERTEIIERFYLYGFAFNFEPYVGSVQQRVSVICAGRGAEETFPGGFCEAYPEVREYWLDHTEDLLKAGFDGVVIRLQAHSSIAVDYKNYGFNEPIVEKYKEKYGVAAYNALMEPAHTITDEEALRLMAIRGEFFMLYAQEASELCHKYGKEFAVMLRESYCDPIISSCQDEVAWWCMPKVILDWKAIVDLNDFIVIKDYIRSEGEVKVNAREIREYAKSQNKKVWIECYDSQAGMFTDGFFYNAITNTTIDGVILYELSGIDKYVNNNLAAQMEHWGFHLANPIEETKK